MIVYHHDDMDGKTAGWLVHSNKNNLIEDTPNSYVMMSYNDKFDKHTEKDDVFVVDFSISDSSYEDFINLCKTARTVTWIDHHATSLDVIEKHKDELQAISNLTYFVSKCACGAALVYSFFKLPQSDLFKIRKIEDGEEYSITAEYDIRGIIKVTLAKFNKTNKADGLWFEHEIPMPKWLYHIDDYDCWKKNDKDSNLFILGTETIDTSISISGPNDIPMFNSEIWDNIVNANNTPNFVEVGQHIMHYLERRYAREAGSTFVWEDEGTKFICKNGTGNSWEFGDLLKKYEAGLLFNYDGKSGMWEYSVYADENSNYNARAFAEKFGGGGHPKCAGFSTKDLIFTAKKETQKSRQIFLGGTVNSNWRESFIAEWKKSDEKKKTNNYILFDPIVPNWTPECIDKENKIKEHAALNLFVVIPEKQSGMFTYVEAVECSHYGKTFLAIYDEFESLTEAEIKSFEAMGDIIKKHGGKFEIYHGEHKMSNIVADVIKAL